MQAPWAKYCNCGCAASPRRATRPSTQFSTGSRSHNTHSFQFVPFSMIWRATGTVTVKAKPEKQIKQVEKILKKLGNKWDKILAGKGK